MEKFMNINKRLLEAVNQSNRNILIIGPGGCGKSYFIETLMATRDDIIVVAPSGIAAWNINGRTIQSFFSITPRQYTGEESSKNYMSNENIIKKSNILLIDEISMLRCEILDIVDYKLRCIKDIKLPFGGMKLLFLGDPCQMEPVTLLEEYIILGALYPDIGKDYNFYNSNAMRKDNFFDATFDIYQINQDYRHKDDILFMKMLFNIRVGKITSKELNILNSRFIDMDFYNEKYQYLTVTNSMAQKYNNYFYEKLERKEYITPCILKGNEECEYQCDISLIKNPFHKTLRLKENMKIIFVKNDSQNNGKRWVNGTMGKITGINTAPGSDYVVLVIVETTTENQEPRSKLLGMFHQQSSALCE
jgi:hypothetical protein